MTYSPLQLAVAALVVCAASTIKGAIGFGFPLVAVPLLSTILGPRVAVPIIAIPTLLSNLIVASRTGRSGFARPLVLLLAGLIVGTVVGAVLITSLDPRVLDVLVGVVAVLYVAATAFRLTLKIPSGAEHRVASIVGVFAGLMGGSTGIFAPLLASYMHFLQLPKREFVFGITLLFFVGNLVQVISYFRLGLYAGPALHAALLACLPMALGTWAGLFLQDRLSPAVFERVVLGVVFLASLNLLARGLFR
ncbi:MAG TPA: sulfite exporter TauE/SafE family protein [bacterium]|nr:sulfite exporter TauE/SafE family protein [bacterium]